MGSIVAKEFKTVDRKFNVGDPISESDINPEGHLSFGDWKTRGFISDPDTAAPPTVATEPASLAPADKTKN